MGGRGYTRPLAVAYGHTFRHLQSTDGICLLEVHQKSACYWFQENTGLTWAPTFRFFPTVKRSAISKQHAKGTPVGFHATVLSVMWKYSLSCRIIFCRACTPANYRTRRNGRSSTATRQADPEIDEISARDA